MYIKFSQQLIFTPSQEYNERQMLQLWPIWPTHWTFGEIVSDFVMT